MTMDSYVKVVGAVMCLAVVAVAGVLTYVLIEDTNQWRAAEQFGVVLEKVDLIVVEGIIQSPSVIIVVGTPEEFMTIVKELRQDTVYYYPRLGYPSDRAYYVFNDEMTIAWKYIPKAGN